MTFTKTQFPSGLRLLGIPLKGAKTVTVLIVVKTGSAYETKELNGISHVLEHMMFKGTKQRPTTLKIAEELDTIGGEYNAFTSKEWTGYYAKADASHRVKILDIISDIFLNSQFREEELNREKLVILEEMNMYQDTPVKYIDDVTEELLYGDQPQGWKVIGERATVQKLTSARLRDYFNKYYTAPNTLVVVAGSYNQKDLAREVRHYLGKQSRQLGRSKKTAVVERETGPAVSFNSKKTDQTHLKFAWRAYPAGHRDLPALKILNIILGSNMSSRLFINIRERHGLGYYINSEVEAYSDCGYLAVKAGVDNDRTLQAIELILKELRQIKEAGVTAAEINKAKEYYRGKLALSLETSSDWAFWSAEQEILRGEVKTPEQLEQEVSAVSAKDLARVAGGVITNSNLNLAIIGPCPKSMEPKIKRLLRG